MRFIFELKMPNRGSWNDRWSGDDEKYTISREVTKTYWQSKPHLKKIWDKVVEKGKTASFFYHWNDGWTAEVQIRKAKPRERAINRFYGYSWMIDSIIECGKICWKDSYKNIRWV